MPNMDPKKCPMPSQDPNVRNKNFKEVALGYTAEMALNEAKRCLQCKKPLCRSGCPVEIDIPGFIAKVAEGDLVKVLVADVRVLSGHRAALRIHIARSHISAPPC